MNTDTNTHSSQHVNPDAESSANPTGGKYQPIRAGEGQTARCGGRRSRSLSIEQRAEIMAAEGVTLTQFAGILKREKQAEMMLAKREKERLKKRRQRARRRPRPENVIPFPASDEPDPETSTTDFPWNKDRDPAAPAWTPPPAWKKPQVYNKQAYDEGTHDVPPGDTVGTMGDTNIENTDFFLSQEGTSGDPPGPPHDDDARAHVVITLISPAAHALASEVAGLAGVGRNPKGWPVSWCGAAQRVQGWLDRGWTPDAIRIGVQKGTASLRERGLAPATSPRYFEKPIAQTISATKPQENYFWRAARDRKKSAFNICADIATELSREATGPHDTSGSHHGCGTHAVRLSAGVG